MSITYKQNSFSPLLMEFNKHSFATENWMRDVDIYGLKYMLYDYSYKYYNSLDASHSHSFWEIHLMQMGEQNYKINETKIHLKTDEFLMICPGTTHCQLFENKTFTKFSLLLRLPVESDLFSKEMYKIVESRGFVKANASASMIGILKYLFSTVGVDDSDALQNTNDCMILFLRALVKCLRTVLAVDCDDQIRTFSQKSKDAEFCERVIDYIRDNISVMLPVEKVAEHFFISSRHLNRKLRSYYEKSYSMIADKIRADYARDLLCYSGLSVEEIAVRVGYSNTSNFIRFFKRMEGQAPTHFRKGFHEMNRGHI
ncbi:MAG: helix-turn-helix transcriptional regulator [Clostridia bacterium]|nr:helix-turn-helix transcriptional regulator [Clostridia bacterium]